MDPATIIMAHEELQKWERRHARLRTELEALSPPQRRARKEELKRVQQQVIYYQNLLQEMKRQLNPPRATDTLQIKGH